MIASFKHHFVFLKTRKTAGTSIEIALSPVCGVNDILTPISLEDELLRMSNGVVLARNFASNPKIEEMYSDAVLRGDRKLRRQIRATVEKEGRFYNHMAAADASKKLPGDFWRSALKFTIVRHPYEKAVSMVYHRARGRDLGQEMFSTALDNIIAQGVLNDFDVFAIGSDIVADRVIYYERLEEDFRKVCAELSVDIPEALPRAKGQTRIDRRPAGEILTDRQKEQVFNTCQSTFSAFGYDP